MPPPDRSPPRGVQRSVGIGMRGTSPWSAMARERLASDPAWRHVAANGRWLCPFCLSAITKRQGRTLDDSVAMHLDNCAHFAAGRGQAQPDAQLVARHQYEDLIHRAESDPAWQVYDAGGTWVCPCCLGRIAEVRRIGAAAPGDLVFRAMAGHLARCGAWRQGQIHAAARVQQARDASGPVAVVAPVAPPVARTLGEAPSGGSRFTLPPVAASPPRGGEPTPTTRRELPPVVPLEPLVRRDGVPPVAQTPPPVARALGPTERFGRNTPLPFTLTPAATPTVAPQQPPPASRQAQPPAAPPVAQPVPIAKRIRTPLPVVAPPPDSDLSWMDQADAAQPESPVAARDRTDVLKARKVQQHMLGELPEIEGFRLAARFEPCDHVSGDFYAFVRRGDGTLAIVIGDVSGHGVQAGLVMSMAKKTCEIYGAMGKGPADTLAMVNEALAGDLAGHMFVSMTMAVLDPAQQVIRWARAGHNPTVRLTAADGMVDEIKPKGMVVGMKAGPLFRQTLEEQAVQVAPGDLFLLYTDGVTETMNAKQEEFGDERLHEVVARHGAEGGEALLSQIVDRIRHFRGSVPPNDDCTLLALEALR